MLFTESKENDSFTVLQSTLPHNASDGRGFFELKCQLSGKTRHVVDRCKFWTGLNNFVKTANLKMSHFHACVFQPPLLQYPISSQDSLELVRVDSMI